MKVVNSNFKTWLQINFKATYFLLGINVLLGIITYVLAYIFFQGSDSLALVFLGAQVLPGTEAPFSAFVLDAYRFLTAAFLHGGLIHLLFNMYALYAIGGYIERFFGGKKLFTTYIITAIIGSLVSFVGALIETWSSGGVSSGVGISVGASGAVFGLIGLILGHKYLNRNTYAPELSIDTSNLIWVVAVNIFLGFSINFLGTGVAVNNWAHIGGLIAGFLLGGFLTTKNTFDISKIKKFIEKGLFILSVILFLLAWILNFGSMIMLSAGLFS